jgi:hypothetical protein
MELDKGQSLFSHYKFNDDFVSDYKTMKWRVSSIVNINAASRAGNKFPKARRYDNREYRALSNR